MTLQSNTPVAAQALREPMWAIGLMTGTVVDGNIDVALIKTDGQNILEFGEYALFPYQSSTVELIRNAMEQALGWQFSGDKPAIFEKAEKQLSLEQAAAVQGLLKQADMKPWQVGVVGFHGQTVLHRAPVNDTPGSTLQLGDGALLSKTLGIPVVNDFRSQDMLLGGQGAPLCGVYHRALMNMLSVDNSTSAISHKNAAVLNLGGIGNISWWGGEEHLVAFDTGPANAPINDFVHNHGAGKMDADGTLAASGTVNEATLSSLLNHPYFTKPYPKSLDRSDFTWGMAEGETLENGAALLTAFSASAVNHALNLLPTRPTSLIVCGGGRHNPSLLNAIQQRANVRVMVAESVGWRGDALEAECFAYLGVRHLAGLPISYPSTTGVSQPVSGGVLHKL